MTIQSFESVTKLGRFFKGSGSGFFPDPDTGKKARSGLEAMAPEPPREVFTHHRKEVQTGGENRGQRTSIDAMS